MVHLLNRKAIGFALILCGVAVNATAQDVTGTYSYKIVVGQSAAFEGPAQALGLGMRAGLQAAFHEVNDKGGVNLGLKKIAILYQDDSFGRVGLAGVQKALQTRGMQLSAEGTYKRNSVAVKSALLKIRKSKPEAVVMVGSYKPIAEFVKLARKLRMKSEFVTISFVGSKALASELGEDGEGVVVTQVVPFYEDKSLPIVKSYHAALAATDPTAEAGFVTFEGYIVGKLFISALEKLGSNVSREALIQQFQRAPVQFDMGA